MKLLDISGTYSATSPGEYTAVFIPKEGYAFEDGAETKSVSWGIYYIWKKYNINSQDQAVYTDSTASSQQTMSWNGTLYNAATSYSFDSSNGGYTLTGKSVDLGANVGNNNRLITKSGYKYIKVNNYLRELVSADASAARYIQHTPKLTVETKYSQGSTYYGEVHSIDAAAYPDNDKSGDYWYIKQ